MYVSNGDFTFNKHPTSNNIFICVCLKTHTQLIYMRWHAGKSMHARHHVVCYGCVFLLKTPQCSDGLPCMNSTCLFFLSPKEDQPRLIEQTLLMRWSLTLSKTLLSVLGKEGKTTADTVVGVSLDSELNHMLTCIHSIVLSNIDLLKSSLKTFLFWHNSQWLQFINQPDYL